MLNIRRPDWFPNDPCQTWWLKKMTSPGCDAMAKPGTAGDEMP
jgi:hypothetical protein